MDPAADILAGSIPIEREPDDTGLESPQFRDDIQSMMTLPPENASSFTALLELPATQAMELLHSMGSDGPQMTATLSGEAHHHPINDEHKPYFHSLVSKLTFPSNTALIERAARFSVFAGVHSPETTISVPLNSSANSEKVKNEPTAETDSNLNASQAIASDPTVEITNQKSTKRKEREKKGKASTKKSKNENSEEAEKLPYVHVRARRGQATDSHSLAERARREKINARMKQLQELVPGCNKILGTALVLDEIINHVQSLQSQVEFLSMRLAAVKPRVDFNLDSILATEDGSLMDSNYPGVVVPAMWAQDRQQYQQQQQQWNLDALHQPAWEGREAESHNFITPDTSFLSYDCSANSASLHTNHLKMEL